MSTQTTEQGAGIPEWDLADRLAKALRAAGVSKRDMAEELGQSRQSISAYLGGRVSPKVPVLKVWAMKCGVPYEWLKDGIIDLDGGPNKPDGQVIDATGWFNRNPLEGRCFGRSVQAETLAA